MTHFFCIAGILWILAGRVNVLLAREQIDKSIIEEQITLKLLDHKTYTC